MEIHESAQNVLRRREILADQFYVVFLDRHPEIRPYSVGVDLMRQAIKLTVALMLIEHRFRQASRLPSAISSCSATGTRPAATSRPGCTLFRDCLLETLERFHGPDWGDRLSRQWRHAIGLAAEAMIRGYDGDYRD